MSGEPIPSDSSALFVLELLAGEMSTEQIEQLTQEARGHGHTTAQRQGENRAAILGLGVYLRLQRHRQRARRATTLLEIADELVLAHSLTALLRILTVRARTLLGCDLAYLTLHGPDGIFHIRASEGHVRAAKLGERPAHGSGLGSLALAEKSPFRTSDYLEDTTIDHTPEADEVIRCEGIRAMLAAPLGPGPESLGTLYVAERRVRHFTSDEESLIGRLGEFAGGMVRRTQPLDTLAPTVSDLERENARLETENRRAQETTRLYTELTELVLGGADLAALATAAGRRLGCPVRIHTASGVTAAVAGELPVTEEMVASAAVHAHVARRAVPVGELWAAPIRAGDDALGVLLLGPGATPANPDEDLLAVITQVAAVVMAMRGMRGDLGPALVHDEILDDLLAPSGWRRLRAERRARRRGVQLEQPHVVVAIRMDDTDLNRVGAWATSYARRQDGLGAVRDGGIVLVVPGTDPSGAARQAAAALSPVLRGAPFGDPVLGRTVTASGAGPVTDLSAVHGAYHEALRCLDAMIMLGNAGHPASADDIGFLGVLLSDRRDVEGFVRSMIGPVLDHDERRRTDLVRTLAAYFETGGSPTLAAQRLHVHPNTVARRMDRIAGLLGADWQKPERALEIQVALRFSRIRQVLRATGAPNQPV